MTPAELERLALLGEEMGEAQQMIGKIIRHGYESMHPDGGPTNREGLTREVGDILTVLSMFFEQEDLSLVNVLERHQEKCTSMAPYLHHNTPPTMSDIPGLTQ